MITRFRNRKEAGKLLAESLHAYAGQPGVLVLGLPRGGVPVAAEVARKLKVPLDVFVVRKLGLPGQEELAMGAIASGGIRVINHHLVEALGIPAEVIEKVAAHEQRELERREWTYREILPALYANGKTVILVDDGIATGATMLAAVSALRKMQAGRIVVAAPTVAASTAVAIRKAADELVATMTPEFFSGVGQWYEDFSQTTDAEVRHILAEARASL